MTITDKRLSLYSSETDPVYVQLTNPQEVVRFQALLNADCVDQAFFLVPTALNGYVVSAITEIHSTAGNDAGSVTLQITKDTGTAAPGTGTALLSSAFNMKGTANTQQSGTLVTTAGVTTLAAGDRLAADFGGTVTSLAGVNATIVLTKPAS